MSKPKSQEISQEDIKDVKNSIKQESSSPEANDKSKVYLFSRSINNIPSIVTIEDKNPAELFRGASNSLREIAANFGDDSRNDDSQQVHSDIELKSSKKDGNLSQYKYEVSNNSRMSVRAISKSLTPEGGERIKKSKRIVGYRTLDYPDLLMIT